MVVHLIPNTLSRVLTPLHTAQRVIIRNEPAGLACHLRVYREQLNDVPAIRADLFDARGSTRFTLAATLHREEPFDRRAKACGRLSCVIIYYDCLGCTQYHRDAPLRKTTQASRQPMIIVFLMAAFPPTTHCGKTARNHKAEADFAGMLPGCSRFAHNPQWFFCALAPVRCVKAHLK